MDYPNRLEWQTRCEFNAYCKHTLRNELIDALRESKKRERNEVSFSALTPQEEKQLYTVDKYFANEDEETFCAGGLKITAKLLADAMHSLPDEKRRTVLLYYFFEMTDAEIAELMKIPRSTVQYRRTRWSAEFAYILVRHFKALARLVILLTVEADVIVLRHLNVLRGAFVVAVADVVR